MENSYNELAKKGATPAQSFGSHLRTHVILYSRFAALEAMQTQRACARQNAVGTHLIRIVGGLRRHLSGHNRKPDRASPSACFRIVRKLVSARVCAPANECPRQCERRQVSSNRSLTLFVVRPHILRRSGRCQHSATFCHHVAAGPCSWIQRSEATVHRPKYEALDRSPTA